MNAFHRPGGDSGRAALGAWVKLPGTESTEIMSDAGFDFCVVDLEHTLLDLSHVYAHLVVGSSRGLRMLVRIPELSPPLIQRLLDAGADGVLAPHVDHPVAAGSLVAAARFSSEKGTRGSGATSRAGRWAQRPRQDYLADGGITVAQIESLAAARRMDSICAVPGLSAVMLGPADLALDLARADGGTPVDQTARSLVETAHSHHVLAGTACAPAAAPDAARSGFDFIVCGNDATFLAATAHQTLADLTTAELAPVSTPTHAQEAHA